MNKVLLKANNVSKTFSPYFFLKSATTKVFSDITFELFNGECLGIIGPNGVGKTTLIKVIAGLIEQSSGEIIYSNELMEGNPLAVKRNIGIAGSEERSFFWRLSAYDNLDFFGSLYDIPKQERQAAIESLLDFFGLLEVKDKRFMLFSSGMKQKLILIRAIIHKPRLLLLDEPLKNLDMVSKIKFLEWLEESIQQQHISAIFISHELEDLLRVSDRIAVMGKDYFTIFPCSRVKEIADVSKQVRIRVSKIHDASRIPFEGLTFKEENDYSVLYLSQPDENNRLKKLLDILWAGKIELLGLEMLPANVETVMNQLHGQAAAK